MTTWKVLLAESEEDSAAIREIEVEARSKAIARELAYELALPGEEIADMVSLKSQHGGSRPGSGQPSRYGKPTKAIRVSEDLVHERAVIEAIPELRILLNELEQDCRDNPDSARRYFLRQALANIRALGF